MFLMKIANFQIKSGHVSRTQVVCRRIYILFSLGKVKLCQLISLYDTCETFQVFLISTPVSRPK